MKILWLCSWYPNKIKPFDGDFIQRHARAVALLHEVQVIHVVKDNIGKMPKPVTVETTSTGNLSETIIYYKNVATGFKFLDRLLSANMHRKLLKSATKKYLLSNPGLELIHVHVAMKSGAIAYWVKKRYGIPFLVSEHWTGYLSEAKPNVDDQTRLIKFWMKKILINAHAVTAVSEVLANAIKKRFNVPAISIVPNVVDTTIFRPVTKSPAGKTKFIHVSTMTYQKNIEQLLMACNIVKKISPEFILDVFVPATEFLHNLVEKYEVKGYVNIHEEVPQQILATEMQQADALLLFSRYETFGCVVIEANACGVPAILSDLDVFREYSIEQETALFVPQDNIQMLADTMIGFINHRWTFDPAKIAKRTEEKFGYSVIANKFNSIYQELKTSIIN